MIYRLDFNRLYEWSNSNSASSRILESVHKLLPDSLLLYRYKIKKSIENKFGINDPEKINFDLIKNKSVVIYHLDIYMDKPLLINDLIKFCIENDKDLFIPTQQERYYGKEKEKDYKFDIAFELDSYDYQYFDMSSDNSLVQLKRELVLSSL